MLYVAPKSQENKSLFNQERFCTASTLYEWQNLNPGFPGVQTQLTRFKKSTIKVEFFFLHHSLQERHAFS